MAAILLAASLTLSAGYTADVQQARHWLRERTQPAAFRCLHVLWDAESGWRVRARGPMTRWGRAYGIPQALPGRKMRSAERPARGPRWDDWREDALVQASWGWHYIRARYGTTCRALAHFRRFSWY